MKLNDISTEMKIDTGADVSVVPESLFRKLKGITLKSTSKKLYGPSGRTLTVQGKFTASLQVGEQMIKERVYVISGLRNALLGQPAIKSLKLLTICQVETD